MRTTASLPAQIGTRYRCGGMSAVSCDRGDGKPKRKKCSYCGSARWMTEEGYYFVVSASFEQHNTPMSQLPGSLAVNAFRTEAQARAWIAKNQPDDYPRLFEMWVGERDRRYPEFVSAVNGRTAAIGGDDNPESDRVYLVDTDNRPMIYGDDASPTPASFLWPRDVAQAAIGTAYVPSTGEFLPAAQVMDPAHYTVMWANRHGLSAWWLMAKEGRTASTDPDYSKCPECGHTLQWGRHPGEAGRFGEELAFCPYCEWNGTEDDFRREAKAEGWKPVPTGPEGEAETITIGNLFAAVSKDHWVYRWAVYTVSPEEVMARGMASSMDEAKAEASAALASAPWAKAAALDEPPRLAPGFVVVKVNSHRARQKLDRLVGPSLSYGRWDHEGEFRIIPEEHLAEAVRIAGVTHVKRPETHTDHHVHWDQDPSIPGLLPREALGEKKAPPQVDTLRDEACPVCGETEAYSGDECGVCGFVKPPDAFMDPNVEKAQQVDLRQDQQEAGQAPAQGESLQCDNCGKTFGAEGQAAAPGTANPAAPSAGGGLERFKVAAKRDPFAEGQRAGKGRYPYRTFWCPWPKGSPEAEQYRKGWEQASGQKWSAKEAVLPAPTSDGDPVDEDPTATAPKAGDACPECGEGTLHPVQAAPSTDEGAPTPPVEAPAEPGDVSDEQAPADGEGDPKAEKPEESKPEGEQPDDEDDEDDDADPKAPKDSSKGHKESTMRPTLKRLAQQQVMIESLAEGLDSIATAAGLDLTPIKERTAARLSALNKGAAGIPDGPVVAEDKAVFEVVASTRKVADTANPANPIPEPSAEAPAVTTEEAKTPQATTDVTSPAIGSEVATENVSPDANTSLQSNETVLDQPLDLNEQTVTAPVAGTQTNDGAHKVEHDISSNVDSPHVDGPAFPLQGPFAQPAKVTGSAEAPAAPVISEGRTFASMRLARLRIQAGIVPAQDDLVLAQAIAKDASLTDDAIASETATLDKVVTAAAQAQPVRPVARSLVPRAAAATAEAQVERTVPSLVTAAAASPVGGPSAQAVTADEVDALW